MTDDALPCLEEAAQALRSAGMRNEHAVTQTSIGLVLSLEGKPSQAIKVHETALATFTDLKALKEIGVCHLNLAQLYSDEGKLAKAQEHAAAARSTLAPLDAAPDRSRVDLLIGQLAGASGDSKRAIAEMTRALVSFERLGMPLDYIKGSLLLGDLYTRLRERQTVETRRLAALPSSRAVDSGT